MSEFSMFYKVFGCIHACISNLFSVRRDWKYLNAIILCGCFSLNVNEKTSHPLNAFIALNGTIIQQNSSAFER